MNNCAMTVDSDADVGCLSSFVIDPCDAEVDHLDDILLCQEVMNVSQ